MDHHSTVLLRVYFLQMLKPEDQFHNKAIYLCLIWISVSLPYHHRAIRLCKWKRLLPVSAQLAIALVCGQIVIRPCRQAQVCQVWHVSVNCGGHILHTCDISAAPAVWPDHGNLVLGAKQLQSANRLLTARSIESPSRLATLEKNCLYRNVMSMDSIAAAAAHRCALDCLSPTGLHCLSYANTSRQVHARQAAEKRTTQPQVLNPSPIRVEDVGPNI